MAIAPSTLDQATLSAWRSNCTSRLEVLRGYRWSWWSHWGALAEMFLPRRYRYFITPNQYQRGSPINGQIVDETGLLAARTLATGLLANLTSPTTPWFKLGITGRKFAENSPAQIWLAECTKRMLEVYAGSNFYNTLGAAYHDLTIFGSASLIQYEDTKDVIRFFNPCLGEFFFGLDNRLTVDTLYREYTYTICETVEEFGLDNVSESVKSAYKTGGTMADQEIVICHAIEANADVYNSAKSYGLPVSSRFSYRELYWEKGSGADAQNPNVLRVAGFLEKPFVGLRWDVTSNDAYGRSPGMDALPAVRQLQIEQRRKAEAIDKMVRPPMVASVSMKNEPMDIMPGGVSYVADPAGSGFKAAFTVDPRIQELMIDLQEVQSRVRATMFNDLFRPALDEGKVQTATYWESVKQEQLVLLGPVVERVESEGLDDIINRTFAIMSRRGLFPEPPPELAGLDIDIQYISILAQVQRASAAASIERTFMFAGNLVAVIPGIMDNLDGDIAINDYAETVVLNPRILRTPETVAAIRANRQATESAAAAMTTGATLASGAKTLSETQVGGGQSALETMLQ